MLDRIADLATSRKVTFRKLCEENGIGADDNWREAPDDVLDILYAELRKSMDNVGR